ncbi:hypothetical protein BDN72DRAFT_774449 [Pluteus cervinus]|uniref:Uncharacterized protein n=1 Tax=Pluteus cervinus TaxID=181527 RepID=A0ACD3AFK5_9AGAR|nr:hypothetical protein BDN72DRAFT_774449 [Pluteus cervinus]
MELFLLQNDPSHTKYSTSDGRVVYNTETISPSHLLPSITSVTRYLRNANSGIDSPVEVGHIEHQAGRGTSLRLSWGEYAELRLIVFPATEEDNGRSWIFVGPNDQSYKWQILFKYPVLLTNDNSRTPIARYHRAKLGIISRSRRGSLEILPAGADIADIVVVTFVSFMKQRGSLEYHHEG